jgi:hypothetical protein
MGYFGHYPEELRELLFQNYPERTSIFLRLRFCDDGKLSSALQSNEHVNVIVLGLENMGDNTDWSLSLDVIATRENLQKVGLTDNPISPEQIVPFLLAVQRNPRVQAVRFTRLQLPSNSIASFLDTATGLRTLELGNSACVMDAPAGARTIAAALQCNTNIQRLVLEELDERLLIPIVSSLCSNTSVRELALHFANPSLAETLAVGHLLEYTETIQKFEACILGGVDVDTYQPIAQGLIRSKSITELKLEDRSYNCANNTLILNKILQSKSNLQSLALTRYSASQGGGGQEEFYAAIFSLLHPHSSLRSFELNHRYSFQTSQDFGRLCAAIETSPLERFSIGTVTSKETCLALIASIPKMQIRTLEFNYHGDLQDMKRGVIQAVKQNASLRTVVAKVGYGVWPLDNDDREKLTCYSLRNEFLALWIENPNAVFKAAWPEYLDVAQTTGPDTVFRVLLALVPSLGD